MNPRTMNSTSVLFLELTAFLLTKRLCDEDCHHRRRRPQSPSLLPNIIVSPLSPSHIIEVIVHTGQHFDADMSDVFFKELDIPRPDNNLGINSASHGAMTGRMLENLEEILIKKTRTGSLFLEMPTPPRPGRLPR